MIEDIKITEGSSEVIDLTLAKKHLRVDEDYTDEDDLINVAITSARVEAENYIERKILSGSVVVLMNQFESFSLPFQSINDDVAKVEYKDQDTSEFVELSSELYTTSKTYTNLFIKFKNEGLPELDLDDAVVRVTIAFGYNFEKCPKPIISAMLLFIADAYDKRENRVSMDSNVGYNLLNPYRKWL